MIESTKHSFSLRGFNGYIPAEDESIPLIITKPPVPMHSVFDPIWKENDENIAKFMDDDEGMKAFEAIHKVLLHTWTDAHRMLSPGGVLAVFVEDIARTIGEDFRLYSNQSKIIGACSKLGFDLLPSILISCPNPRYSKYVGSGLLPIGAYVPVENQALLFFRKKGKREFTKKEKQWRSRSVMLWEERNEWLGTLWDINDQSEFYKRVIMMWSIYGDVVVDPFAEDANLSEAAASTGRGSVSCYQQKSQCNTSGSILTKRNTKQRLNGIIESRISNHWKYVQSKDMLYFRYKNESHGFPVKSSQERKLTIYPIKSISRSDDEVTVKYQKLKKEKEEILFTESLSQPH